MSRDYESAVDACEERVDELVEALQRIVQWSGLTRLTSFPSLT